MQVIQNKCKKYLFILACILIVVILFTVLFKYNSTTTQCEIPLGEHWVIVFNGKEDKAYSCLIDGDYLYACGYAKSFDGKVRPFIIKISLKEEKVEWCKVVENTEGIASNLIKKNGKIIVCGSWRLTGFLLCLNDNGGLEWGYACNAPLQKLLDLGDKILAYSADGVLVFFKLNSEIVNQVRILVKNAREQWLNFWLLHACTVSGKIYLVGHSDNLLSDNSGSDFLLICIDSNGNLLWSKALGGAKDDWLLSITSDSKYLYVCGYTWSFGFGEADVFTAKLSLEGKLEWARVIGDKRWDTARLIHLAGDCLHVFGFTYSFSPKCGFFINKLDKNGNLAGSWIIESEAKTTSSTTAGCSSEEEEEKVKCEKEKWDKSKFHECKPSIRACMVKVIDIQAKTLSTNVICAKSFKINTYSKISLILTTINPRSLDILRLMKP